MIKVDVYGVRETLAELRKYEAETFKRIKTDLIQSAQPAADAVGREFPAEPLMNWHSSGGRLASKSRLPPYNGAAAKTKVKVAVSTKRPRGLESYGLVRLQQMDGGAQVYDSAGSRLAGKLGKGSTSGQRFVANLDKQQESVRSVGHKTFRSRIMFGAVKNNEHLIEEAVLKVVKEVDGYTTKRINAQGTR